MRGKHFINPIDLDMDGDWDGVVKFINGEWIRYIDRDGQNKEPINERN